MTAYHLLRNDLIRDEGLKLKPYKDGVGKLTIGVGRNLDDRGITEVEAYAMCDHDIEIVATELDRNASWWRDLPEPAQRGLMNMCFNMGWPRLSRFQRMLSALKLQSFKIAATEALDSTWAKQVGARAERIAGDFRGCEVSE